MKSTVRSFAANSASIQSATPSPSSSILLNPNPITISKKSEIPSPSLSSAVFGSSAPFGSVPINSSKKSVTPSPSVSLVKSTVMSLSSKRDSIQSAIPLPFMSSRRYPSTETTESALFGFVPSNSSSRSLSPSSSESIKSESVPNISSW